MNVAEFHRLCCDDQHYDAVVRALDAEPRLADAVDRASWSPLHWAAGCNAVKVTQVLLERGARVDIVSTSNEDALMRAASYGHCRTARLLLERGASTRLTNNSGLTAQQIATRMGKDEFVALLREFDTLHRLATALRTARALHALWPRCPTPAFDAVLCAAVPTLRARPVEPY
mmetsp:Transcript_46150/g.113229  ORF Transcript_46150/g.113229 Transcript_46150/m.113229 type:complete len:173 (-) Transcript_46150:2-520(-)